MKLLVLTSRYPDPNSTLSTSVVHYYVREWIKQGHSVRVMYSQSVFPVPYHFVARLFKATVKRIFKTDIIPFTRLNQIRKFSVEGVNVVSLPIFKWFPHVRYLRSTIRNHARRIYEDNETNHFQPEYIIGHFLNPQLPLITELKRLYPGAKASLVIHEDPLIISALFGRLARSYLNNVDHLGFRFREQQVRYVNRFGARDDLFICPSGVPEKFILGEIPSAKFTDEKISLCFAGMLIPLKNVDILIRALHQAFPRRNFNLRIIGDGLLRESLSDLTRELGLAECIVFEGHLPREKVQEILAVTDVFVMVSKPEAFGLVYVEAMAKGCITIGTRGQGIDGVINHKENGFLCQARDVDSLASILLEIEEMPYEQKIELAKNALQTASALSDVKVAASYLEKLRVQ